MKKKELNILYQLGMGTTIRNYYSGSGRYTRKSADCVEFAIDLLKQFNLKNPRHYKFGNDAPRGGWCGNWIKLTAIGKNMKVIKNAVVKYNAVETKKTAKIKIQRHNEATQALPQLCKERLDNNLSGNYRKRLNAKIRLYAEILDIEIPDNEFLQFVQQHAN